MSNTVQLSDVQLLNLSVLMTIQASIKKDPVAACYQFNLRDDQAHRVEGLGQQQLQAIVANRGHESLFKLARRFLAVARCTSRSPGSLVHGAHSRDSGHRRRTPGQCPDASRLDR